MNKSENPKAILQKICREKDPEHWVPAFTNFLLRHPSDAELAEYAKNLIFYKMLLDGSESSLSSMVSYPVSVDWLRGPRFLESKDKDRNKVLVHLSADQIFGSTNPVRECFIKTLEDWLGGDFNLSGRLKKIEGLIEAYINTRSGPIGLHDKSNHAQKTLKVGMLPYHDTLMIPLLLEAVNESTEKFTIDFDLHYFPDVSDNLADRNLSINFLSESRLGDMPDGKFSQLRKENTKIVLLMHKKSSSEDIKHLYSYQGYYAKNQLYRVSKESQIQASSINTEGVANFYEREIDVLLALAAGLFNKEIAVIPSIQGYLWSKDTGLHFEENLGGTLHVHHNPDPSTSVRNDSDKFGIMAPGNNDEANRLVVHLTDIAKELHEEFAKRLRKSASKEKAAALLLTPILTRYPEYSGLLTNISSQLLTRMLEVESDYTNYKPDWFCNKESYSRVVSK